MKHRTAIFVGLTLSLLTSGAALADQQVVKMRAISDQGIGAEIGTITFTDSPEGLRLAFNLRGLPPGDHGIHVHENGSCEPMEKDGQMVAGLAAGGHFDPAHTGHHEGPNGQGHLGDLEVMSVDVSGMDTEITTAKRLQLKELRGHAIIIHVGGDNYADTPKPLGGGGGRIACGVI